MTSLTERYFRETDANITQYSPGGTGKNSRTSVRIASLATVWIATFTSHIQIIMTINGHEIKNE